MKKAVGHLLPYIEEEKKSRPPSASDRDNAGVIIMATVKGDVHDIGKNIVGVVLGCNNFKVCPLSAVSMNSINWTLQAQIDMACTSQQQFPAACMVRKCWSSRQLLTCSTCIHLCCWLSIGTYASIIYVVIS